MSTQWISRRLDAVERKADEIAPAGPDRLVLAALPDGSEYVLRTELPRVQLPGEPWETPFRRPRPGEVERAGEVERVEVQCLSQISIWWHGTPAVPHLGPVRPVRPDRPLADGYVPKLKGPRRRR